MKHLFGDTERALREGDELIFSRDGSGQPSCIRRAPSSGEMVCEAALRLNRHRSMLPFSDERYLQWVDDMVAMASAVSNLSCEPVSDPPPGTVIYRFHRPHHLT